MGAAVGVAMTGLSLFMQGAADSEASNYKAAQSTRAAEIGRIQADQLQTDYLTRANTTFANIRAIRAATGANPNSPTTDAVIANEQAVSDRTSRIKVGGLRMGAAQSENDALFYKSAASSALLGGTAKSLAYFATPKSYG